MKEYYISPDGTNPQGPFTEEDILKQLQSGQLNYDQLIWCEGMMAWVPIESAYPKNQVKTKGRILSANQAKYVSDITKRIKDTAHSVSDRSLVLAEEAGKATGLGKLDGFSFKRFFSEIFRKHTSEEAIDLFSVGTKKTTPSLSEINATWPAPWVFTRAILITLLMCFGFYKAYGEFNNLHLIPGLIFAGSFGIPLCVMILFYEMNIRRDVPFFEAIKAFMLGGLFSLIASLILFKYTDSIDGAWWAGFVEEPGKLLATIIITGAAYRKGNVLHGLLMGCAVGGGFAAFETAGYIYRYYCHENGLVLASLMESEQLMYLCSEVYGIAGYTEPLKVLIIRACYAPCCHVIWTAITAGAFWHILSLHKKENKNALLIKHSSFASAFTLGLYKLFATIESEEEQKVDISVLWDWRFLCIFLIPVTLHAIWNSPILIELGIVRNLALGAISWALAMLLIQVGINQVKKEKAEMTAKGDGEGAASETQEAPAAKAENEA